MPVIDFSFLGHPGDNGAHEI